MEQFFSPLALLVWALLGGVSSSLWPAIARGESPAVINISEQTQVPIAEQFIDALFSNNFDVAWSYLHPQLQKEFLPKRLKQKVSKASRRLQRASWQRKQRQYC